MKKHIFKLNKSLPHDLELFWFVVALPSFLFFTQYLKAPQTPPFNLKKLKYCPFKSA